MVELRQLMFGKEGSSSQLPWPAWHQGFFFSKRPGLGWGLVQRAGGPCGLLAVMQVLTCAMLCCVIPYCIIAAAVLHWHPFCGAEQQRRVLLYCAALGSAITVLPRL